MIYKKRELKAATGVEEVEVVEEVEDVEDVEDVEAVEDGEAVEEVEDPQRTLKPTNNSTTQRLNPSASK